MKSLALFLCLTLFLSAQATAQKPKELVPDSLLNWLRIIETDGFTVIYATDDDGEFKAISVDAEGDLLIASHTRKPEGNEGNRAMSNDEWSMHIVDVQSGKDLWDEHVKKKGPDSARITYTNSNGIWISSITNVYPRGLLYPLKPFEGRKVRYEVFRYVNGAKEAKLSHVLTLPERKARRENE
jgi:hypothetical protein